MLFSQSLSRCLFSVLPPSDFRFLQLFSIPTLCHPVTCFYFIDFFPYFQIKALSQNLCLDIIILSCCFKKKKLGLLAWWLKSYLKYEPESEPTYALSENVSVQLFCLCGLDSNWDPRWLLGKQCLLLEAVHLNKVFLFLFFMSYEEKLPYIHLIHFSSVLEISLRQWTKTLQGLIKIIKLKHAWYPMLFRYFLSIYWEDMRSCIVLEKYTPTRLFWFCSLGESGPRHSYGY